LTDIEIEKLMKLFQMGVIRRSGVRVNMVTCGEVMSALRELKMRRSNDVYSDKR
jgi:hypothetical protein